MLSAVISQRLSEHPRDTEAVRLHTNGYNVAAVCRYVDIRVESALYPPCVYLCGLGRAVRPCSVTHDFGLEWGPNPGAFGQTDAGLGSQLRNLVLRGRRSVDAGRRVSPRRFIAGNPSGAEASSEPVNVRRSKGRGVEEATGTPCIGTPSNPVVRYSYLSFITYLSLGYVIDVSESELEFELWVSISLL